MTSTSESDHRPISWKRTLYILFFAQMITMIGFSSVFPFLPLFVKSLGSATFISTEILTGMVFSGQAITMTIASPIWGKLADRWGRKLMVERATFGGAVILLIMAFVRSAEELVLLRMVQGLVTGVVGAVNALVAATVPRRHTGFAMGLMQVAMGIGVGLGPLLGGLVADAYGYRAAFYITSSLLAVAGIVVFWGVEERFESQIAQKNHRTGFWHDWRRILFTPGVAVVYGIRFINQTGRMIYVPILPMFVLMLLNNSEKVNSFTGLMIGVSAVATAAFSVFLGRIGDRIGHNKILFSGIISCAFLFLIQSLVATGYQLLAMQALTGVALGGVVPAVSALLAKFTPMGEEGAVYGLDGSITSAARALGPMLGVGIAAWLGLRAVFGATAFLYLLAAILVIGGLPRSSGIYRRRQ